jgi:hypothetical protein
MSNLEEKNKRIFRNTINNFRNNRMKQTFISEKKAKWKLMLRLEKVAENFITQIHGES